MVGAIPWAQWVEGTVSSGRYPVGSEAGGTVSSGRYPVGLRGWGNKVVINPFWGKLYPRIGDAVRVLSQGDSGNSEVI
ncbi:hypothetical protein GCM10008018_61180 [Paenibacillus marchantiophytorum]|uniref:Uncharacterized protein n=1 Tax=Paenibacillus marchantiophytorum TaxID=1619310 RepID=A0ABQ1FD84_9BACL|nr:hypothetical protein GCM10008018_61180 [Paenibacillus marchantiophytorum]